MRRRTVIAIAGATVVPAILPRMARAQQRSPLRIGVVGAEVAAEAFYGVDMGFFSKAGLDVSLEPFTNGASVAAAVAGGSIDVGLSDLLSVINAHARGLPFVFVAPGVVTRNSADVSEFGLLVAGNSPIHDAKDFSGKTFATNSLRNIGQLFAETWIDANGGDSRSLHWIELPYPALIPALNEGRVQVIGTNEPFMTLGVQSGDRAIYYERNSIAPTVMLSGWIVTRDWLQKNRSVAIRFAEAIRDIADWANKNRAAATPILAKYTKLAPELLNKMHRSEFSLAFSPAYMQPVIDAALKYGYIDKGFPVADIIASVR